MTATHACPPRAGITAPTNDNGQATATRPPVHKDNQATSILPDSDESCNFAMLAAKAKLRGHTIKKLTSGYLLFSWSLSRHFTELSDLVKVLRQMGVSA